MRTNCLLAVLLPALAMSVGWGFRGDYGHEAGAMIPGALAALAAVLVSGRKDWLQRFILLAFLGAAGWALGGQMSYGKVVGYTMHSYFHEATYGFASLFLIGALWGGMGGGILGLGLSLPKKDLLSFGLPLATLYALWKFLDFSGATDGLLRRFHFHASDWVAALSALAVALFYSQCHPRFKFAWKFLAVLSLGWMLGLAALVHGLGFRMTPPRGDNWTGCLGLFLALLGILWKLKSQPGWTLAWIGFFAGGVGFTLGDFLQVLGRAKWGPISHPWLQGLDYWKWMEQSFGLIMGAGIGWGIWKLRRAPTVDNEGKGALNWLALFFLMFVMFWENLFKNVRNWKQQGLLQGNLFGLETQIWLLILALCLGAMLLWAIFLHGRDLLPIIPDQLQGKAQFLFLWILWLAVIGALMQVLPGFKGNGVVLVHGSFWLTAIACTMLIFPKRKFELPATVAQNSTPSPAIIFAGLGLSLILILGLSWVATGIHPNPLPGAQTRFE
ncbi:MAG: hypothetical protein EXR99_14945 [Gemmataceae bacterium]|nr:hypothetical protein [Gemmataceae bacterium]